MATLATIRAGLAANLAAIPDCQVSAYLLDRPEPPTLQVAGVDPILYDQAMHRGLDELIIRVQGLVGAVADIGSQVLLDEWLSAGARSVKAALEADRTLGGAVHDLRVQTATGHRKVQTAGAEMLGCEWTVQVFN